MKPELSMRFYDLGLGIIPLQPRTKVPDLPSWAKYARERATRDEVSAWFPDGNERNAGITLGPVSGVVVLETDSPSAEHWAATQLPQTPMSTLSARGIHRYYRLPSGPNARAGIPATIRVESVAIEVKRGGQYVVAPGSVHPTGHVYTEVQPWPDSLVQVPEFPIDIVLALMPEREREQSGELPASISVGSRNTLLFREGARLRRFGWSESEICKALLSLNATRCYPPLESREVEAIARSCGRYDAAPDSFPTTEAGDAEFFAHANADNLRYDHRMGHWLLFGEHRFEPQRSGEVSRLALDAARGRQRSAIGDKARLKWATDLESRRRQTNMVALAQSVVPLADAGDSWDLGPWLLGVPNGVVDLTTGVRRDGRPEDRITMATRVPFDGGAACPLWEKTVAEIFAGDDDLISYLHRFVGYSLTGDCREEVLAFCWGEGANGKGTLMNTIAWVLGDYSDDLPFSALEVHNHAGIPNDIAKIVGKRFITSSETGGSQRLNEARVKALTGRDPITARFLHREFFTFQPVAKFWLASNEKPEVRDTSLGFWRRIHLIPFTQSFADRADLELKDKLQAEGPGILAWAVRGCMAWQERGLNPPSVVSEATKAYRTESMPLARFLADCCVVKESARATFGDLFQSYVRWAGGASRMGKHEFSEALRQRFAQDPHNSQRVTFVGVGLLDLFREG